MASFPTVVNETNVQNIDTEWRLLRNSELLSKEFETPTKFWIAVKRVKSGDGNPLFPSMSTVMLNLLCLLTLILRWRVFSAVNRMKTKLRNRLSTKTLSGLITQQKRLVEK